MTDIAELGFAVRTDGLQQGNQALDQTKTKAKELEDQAKKTGDAVSQVGDKAKTSSTSVADLGKQYGLTEGQLRALQTRARESGTSFDEVAKKFVATRDGLRDMAPAAQAAATATQATATAARAAAPAMAQTATAARAAAAAKNEAAISAGALSAALNTARPAIIAAGGALGTLPAVAASARFGIAGVATAITGGLTVALTNIVDKIDAAKSRLGAITGSFQTGSEAVDGFKRSASAGGASVDGMSAAYQKMLGVLRTPLPEPGVIRIGESVDAASQKISDFVTSASKALKAKFVDPAEIDKQLATFADAFKAAGGRITGDVLRGVSEKAPELGRALALGFLGRGAGEGENIIETAARQLDSFPRKLDDATAATRRYGEISDTAYNPNRVKPLSQALDELGRTATDIIERIGRVGGLSGIVDEANERLKRGADAAMSPKDFGSDTSRTNATAMQPQETPSLWQRITDADRAMFGDDPTGVGSLVNRFNSWIADQFKGQEGERGTKFSDLMGGGSGSLSRSETSDILEGINKSLVGFDDVATEMQKASESAKGTEGAIDSVGNELSEAGDASGQLADSLPRVSETVSAAGTAMAEAATGADAFATAVPIAAEAATAFAGATTEAMGGASTAIVQAKDTSAAFAQGFDGSMASAAASAEAGADRIVSAMQRIIDAANAAAAARAGATGGDFGGVGSVPYAMGGVFSGGTHNLGRVIPFANGGIIDRPTFMPMADGMALTGEAGPEAIMPLARGPDGKLGVTVSGSGSRSLVPSDPFTDIEIAIEDQTTELRNAMDSQADAIGGDITKSAADIIAAIKASQISIGASGGSSLGSVDGLSATGGGASSAPGGALGASVEVGDGSGTYTSSQSFFGGAGNAFQSGAQDIKGAAGTFQSAAGQFGQSVGTLRGATAQLRTSAQTAPSSGASGGAGDGFGDWAGIGAAYAAEIARGYQWVGKVSDDPYRGAQTSYGYDGSGARGGASRYGDDKLDRSAGGLSLGGGHMGGGSSYGGSSGGSYPAWGPGGTSAQRGGVGAGTEPSKENGGIGYSPTGQNAMWNYANSQRDFGQGSTGYGYNSGGYSYKGVDYGGGSYIQTSPPNYDYGSDTAYTNANGGDSWSGSAFQDYGYSPGGGGYNPGGYDTGDYYGYGGGTGGYEPMGWSGGDYYSAPSEDYYGGAYATGGSFVVPGSGGTDSVRVGLDATPGEVVSVTKPGQSDAGGTTVEGGINISLHGITRPNEWIENEAAINARIAQSVKEALDAR